MNKIAKIVSLITLGLVIVSGGLHFLGMIDLATTKVAALVGTIGWFLATPAWMGREQPVHSRQLELQPDD